MVMPTPMMEITASGGVLRVEEFLAISSESFVI